MQKENITDLIKDAFNLERQGQYKDAIEVLYKGLNDEPDNVEILGQIAELYRKLKNYDIAKEYAKKAINQGKLTSFATNILLKIYIETSDKNNFNNFLEKIDVQDIDEEIVNTIFQGFIKFELYQNAIEFYNKINNKFMDNSQTFYYFALCNYILKNYENAEKYAKMSFEKNSNNTKLLILLANISYKNKKYDDVKNIIAKIDDAGKTDDAWYLLGLVELNEKQYQKAVDYFIKSLSENNKNKEVLYSLSNAYYFLGWFDEALKTIAKAKIIAPNDINVLYLNAEIYFLQEKYELAIQLISSILEQDKSNINAKLLKANIFIKKGLHILAKNLLNEILSINAENTDALKLYYEVCQNLGWIEQAITILEKILVIEPDNIDYLCNLAQKFCTLNRYEDAKIVLKNIFEKSSDYEVAYELALNVYFYLKNYDKVCDIADKWLKINPNSDYAHYILAQIFMEKDLQEGLNEISSALQLNPLNVKYYILAGDICNSMNDFKWAYQYYNEAFDIQPNKDLCFKLLKMAILEDEEKIVEKCFNKVRNFALHDIDITFLYCDYLLEKAYPQKALSLLKNLYGALKDKDLKAIVKAKIVEIK